MEAQKTEILFLQDLCDINEIIMENDVILYQADKWDNGPKIICKWIEIFGFCLVPLSPQFFPAVLWLFQLIVDNTRGGGINISFNFWLTTSNFSEEFRWYRPLYSSNHLSTPKEWKAIKDITSMKFKLRI